MAPCKCSCCAIRDLVAAKCRVGSLKNSHYLYIAGCTPLQQAAGWLLFSLHLPFLTPVMTSSWSRGNDYVHWSRYSPFQGLLIVLNLLLLPACPHIAVFYVVLFSTCVFCQLWEVHLCHNIRVTCKTWQKEVPAEEPKLAVTRARWSPLLFRKCVLFHCPGDKRGVSLREMHLTLVIVKPGKSQGSHSHFVDWGALFECSQPQILLKACVLARLSDHEQHNVSFKQYKGDSMLV